MRFFVGVNGHGILDEDGQIAEAGVMEDGTEIVCGGALVAEEDKPLELVAHILEAWAPMWRYSTAEAAQADLEFFRDFVASFDFEREGPRPRWEWN